jgi:hypothetical protein
MMAGSVVLLLVTVVVEAYGRGSGSVKSLTMVDQAEVF